MPMIGHRSHCLHLSLGLNEEVEGCFISVLMYFVDIPPLPAP